MSTKFKGWHRVAKELHDIIENKSVILDIGQKASIIALAERLQNNGVIIADEVGMGKTRIATVVTRAVVAASGRVAILVPPGLGYQWNDELQNTKVSAPLILRSLYQYLSVWKDKEDSRPWFNESIVVISHAFANWRLGWRSDPWRWALLPEVYAKYRKYTNGCYPRGYHGSAKLCDEWVCNAADSIVSFHKNSQAMLKQLTDETPWPGALDAIEYERNANLRPWLERAVGLGLGEFDLVIIDEAHKSRGEESMLSTLLNNIVLPTSNARYLAMTATPVELNAHQWSQMLGRIRVNENELNYVKTVINTYISAVAQIRKCPSDAHICEQFKLAAEAFKEKLNPYLLRRDKRQDDAVKKFQQNSGKEYHAYRQERELVVDTKNLSSQWQDSVCAAEALSFVVRSSENMAAKRMRLTFANGHGIAACIDQVREDINEDYEEHERTVAVQDKGVTSEELDTLWEEKRQQRVNWWQKVMTQPFSSSDSALYEHPSLLVAIREIENICKQEEKVLVFGRFTRPLRALVQLLNAREMLRCLDDNRLWPQSKVHENDSWAAIQIAHKQLNRKGTICKDSIDKQLAEQYNELINQRRRYREHLIERIEQGFEITKPDEKIRNIFNAFKNSLNDDYSQGNDVEENSLAIVARAIYELVGEEKEDSKNDFCEIIANAFVDLILASSERDEGDTDGDGKLDPQEASELWKTLIGRLREEYDRPEGGYARLMYGHTKPETRRFLQLAFNRKHGYPKVLVAQSLVGREGLNLHKACRTVVLLHPEWNPGVVEQQIGRVDRLGSLWVEMLNAAVDSKASELPRIEIRPIIFQGTYDEKNWEILRERWDDLRSQLHGIVISSRIAEKYINSEELISQINDLAPKFYPE